MGQTLTQHQTYKFASKEVWSTSVGVVKHTLKAFDQLSFLFTSSNDSCASPQYNLLFVES